MMYYYVIEGCVLSLRAADYTTASSSAAIMVKIIAFLIKRIFSSPPHECESYESHASHQPKLAYLFSHKEKPKYNDNVVFFICLYFL